MLDMTALHESSCFDDPTGIVDGTLQGPYQYAGKIRVFGLAADSNDLELFLKSYLKDTVSGSGYNFSLLRPSAPVVYMVVGVFDKIFGGRNRGEFSNRAVQFHIPVRCTKRGESPVSGSLQVFSYASHMWNVITSTEVRGPQTLHAVMRMHTWVEDLHADANRQVSFSISPQTVGENEEVANRQLLSIGKMQQPWPAANEDARRKNTGWDLSDIENVFAVKQFQHETHQDRACYQSLVRIPFSSTGTIQDRADWRYQDYLSNDARLDTMYVKVTPHPYHPIVDKLGLATSEPESSEKSHGKTGDQWLRPLFYFVREAKGGANPTAASGCWFNEDFGDTLCYRYELAGPQRGWIVGPERDPLSGINYQ